MRELPEIGIAQALFIQITVVVLAAGIWGILSESLTNFFMATTLMFAAGLILLALHAWILQIIFRLWTHRFVPWSRMFTVLVVSYIPFFLLQSVSSHIPPMMVLGYALTSLMMIVGLTESLKLPRKAVIQITSAFFVLFLILWSWNNVETFLHDRKYPESADTNVTL
jgi:hypothetical protein